MRASVVILLAACKYAPDASTPGDDVVVVDAAIDAIPIDAPPDPRPTARKKVLTIDPAAVTGNQTDFPVWISLIADQDLKFKAFNDGSDIYFTKADGTPLEFELQRWDKARGDLEAWVRSDLADNAPTIIDVRYGDPAVAHAAAPATVFSNGFAAVWHLEDPNTITDSLGQRPGTPVNGPTPDIAMLGKGVAFDGVDDEITFTSPYTSNDSHTISAWVNASASATGFSSLITVGNNATGASRFLHLRYNSGIGYGFFGNDVQNQTNILGNFHLVHWVFTKNGNAGNSELFVDGQSVNTQNHSGTISTAGAAGHLGTAPQPWGPGGNTTNPIHGTLDEVRLATVPRASGWIKTEFANQNSPGTFYSVGPDIPAN